MLYTGKGDDGTTYFFGSKERFGKDTSLVEALGTLDELNSLLGYLRACFKGSTFGSEILEVQQDLFIIQAELAGADKKIEEGKVRKMEQRIGEIESLLPPITTFFIPGAGRESAMLDYARTVARRAERRVIALRGENSQLAPSEKIPSRGIASFPSPMTLAYLNRLSSLLYAEARLAAHVDGKSEIKPEYK